MTTTVPATVLIVPGVGDSGPAHWQTRMEQAHPGARRVVQDDWTYPVRADWVACLARALDVIDGPVVLVGHSAGSVAIVHWAAAHSHRGGIRGALLVAPADLENELPDGTPVDFLEDAGWIPCPRTPLPFPNIVVASTNDPYATVERSEEFALAWGSRLVLVENAGHLNADAGFGPWPLGDELLSELLVAR
ncbi:MAG: RBBP9/YdeN family alpha/beta hydrolase [Candidatus Binatia bacterium]